jgi:hypothetical protein
LPRHPLAAALVGPDLSFSLFSLEGPTLLVALLRKRKFFS